jgi:acetyl esterase/lipase
LVYPAYLTVQEKNDALAPELPVSATNTPPTFIVMTGDDPLRVENALTYYQALKTAKVPAELHLYPTGGHGYGLRRTIIPVTTWPARVTDWLTASGWLNKTK